MDRDYFTYTGDRAEGWMLRLYRLRPKIGRRREVSATSVRERIYGAASGGDSSWKDDVPPGVAGVIEENWGVVERFAGAEDLTRRIAGMKFPSEGYGEA
ncbi:hypothetical protein CENSYa_1716 [Cenarchaeum symbiosum A]|uniref:Uncharacterized protein n=1 Tax=Cenarchaeum symbiosum (strain A) TaxID=414004 RepID=A0RYB1_CENSY|nr:hypothetical protein CENSYa_1716 [Cenarchaeum symbiosum A]